MSVFQLLDLLRLVWSGYISLWCQGIKANVAQCQRLDLFSPPSRNTTGQRDEELTIWRLIISGLIEIGHEGPPRCGHTDVWGHTHTYLNSFFKTTTRPFMGIFCSKAPLKCSSFRLCCCAELQINIELETKLRIHMSIEMWNELICYVVFKDRKCTHIMHWFFWLKRRVFGLKMFLELIWHCLMRHVFCRLGHLGVGRRLASPNKDNL